MPLLPRTGGLHGKPLEDITFIEFQKGVCEEWFQSDTHFRHYMLQRQVLDEDGQNVSLTLRSIAVFLRTGIVLGMHKSSAPNAVAQHAWSAPSPAPTAVSDIDGLVEQVDTST